jgi:hypothetical protein
MSGFERIYFWLNTMIVVVLWSPLVAILAQWIAIVET